MSMPMPVGKVILETEFIVAEVEKDLFPMSLTGATMQDGGTRERRDAKGVVSSNSFLCDYDIK